MAKIPAYTMGLDPGPKWTAAAIIRYEGDLMQYERALNYRILNFWLWRLRGDDLNLDNTATKLAKYMDANPFIKDPKVVKLVESQEGGKVAFMTPRNHNIAGTMVGYLLGLHQPVHYMSKREKWPCSSGSKDDRVKHVTKIMRAQHLMNGKVYERYKNLRNMYSDAPMKVYEDVADAILIATDKMRKFIIEYLRAQGRIGRGRKRPFTDSKSRLKDSSITTYVKCKKRKTTETQ
jgi:hypothetical protein